MSFYDNTKIEKGFIRIIPILVLIYFVDKHIVIGDNDDIYGDNDGHGSSDKLAKANPNLTDTKEPPRASE